MEMKSRDNLPEYFKSLGFKVGAEIGVFKGEFTEKFCKAGLKMYAIDPWISYEGAGRTQEIKARQDFLYGHAGRVLAPYDCALIRKTSVEALKDFEDESLDFVYIDGDHSFKHVATDIEEWTKKVKKGGVVSGHDYLCYPPSFPLVCQVKYVVDAYVKTFNIKNLTIFGKIVNPKKKDDKYNSWMFRK